MCVSWLEEQDGELPRLRGSRGMGRLLYGLSVGMHMQQSSVGSADGLTSLGLVVGTCKKLGLAPTWECAWYNNQHNAVQNDREAQWVGSCRILAGIIRF